jgi:hypothetical protein
MPDRPHRLHDLIRLPFRRGRLLWTPDPGHAYNLVTFQSHLEGTLTRPDGTQVYRDLGSGLVTNVGVLSMANDYAWSAQLNLATLALANFHATGIGTAAAAATDVALQSLAAPTTVTAVTGTQSLVSAANSQQYKTIATVNYTSTLAITEWGLHTLATLTSATGSPFTAAAATSWTDTGSAQTASSATVRGLQGTIVVPGTTAVWMLNLSNTTHVGTGVAWYKVSDGTGGATPGNTETFAIKPVLWDRKVFSAFNVNSGDSIAFTYTLTVNSGG